MGRNAIGTAANPLRVAIVGAGPAGFYTAEHLFRQQRYDVEVDVYDRLPTPFGLVRDGVAPDHQKIKAVTKAYDRIASNPRFRYYGHVEFGTDVNLDDLEKHYHQIVFAVGAQIDKTMGIPGEQLERSYAATEFVAWYNGHPDYRDRVFDLSQEVVAVVGVGNVAVDVCRMLCRSREELEKTDIADYALEALGKSNVKTVLMLGRRGPAQAAFTNPELKELGHMEVADIRVPDKEVHLDEATHTFIARNPVKSTQRKLEILQQFAAEKRTGKLKTLTLRFCVSPVELLAGNDGGVAAIKLVRNDLYLSEHGEIRPHATEHYEQVPVGVVFRSVGYHGVALPDVPFRQVQGVIPNNKGRVLERFDDPGSILKGLYCAGWIKRGPIGVIGTNRPDARETVECMLKDFAEGFRLEPHAPGVDAAEELVTKRKPNYFSFEDWQKLDALEIEQARGSEAPRAKFTSVDAMQEALGR